MKKSGFFNSVNGDRTYSADDWAGYFASFIANGVMPRPSDALQVVAAGDGMKIKVKKGRAWINGYFLNIDAEEVKTLANADGVLKRIDRVVARWNLINREITLDVKQGQYNSIPVPAEVTRNTDIYELALADVLVGNGVVEITQSAITDKRLDAAVCGVSIGIIQQIDATAFGAQLEAWMNEFKGKKQTEFQAWFQGIVDVLDENSAANLMNQINKKQPKNARHTLSITTSDWADYSAPEEDWTKKKVIEIEGVTADDVPQLNFTRDCKVAATDAGVTQVETENGKLVLYAESVPSKTLTAELLLHKA